MPVRAKYVYRPPPETPAHRRAKLLNGVVDAGMDNFVGGVVGPVATVGKWISRIKTARTVGKKYQSRQKRLGKQ